MWREVGWTLVRPRAGLRQCGTTLRESVAAQSPQKWEYRIVGSFRTVEQINKLGEDGWEKLFPGEKNGLKWSEFRKSMYEYLKSSQNADGSWNGGGWVSAPALATSMNLTILQLENATLPIYQR